MRTVDPMQSWSSALLLIGVTAVWGWTFVVVQDAISAYGVLGFLALRFALASVALAPLLLGMTRRTLLVGSGIGLILAMGYLFQTLGLLYTTPTNSGLITGLFVVFAPLTARALFKVHVSRHVVAAVILSLTGLVLLAGQSPSGVRIGDALTVVCAMALGMHIALLSRYAREHNAGSLALAQMLSMAVLFSLTWPLFEPVAVPPREVIFAIFLTGLVASAVAFYVQTTVQQRIPAAPRSSSRLSLWGRYYPCSGRASRTRLLKSSPPSSGWSAGSRPHPRSVRSRLSLRASSVVVRRRGSVVAPVYRPAARYKLGVETLAPKQGRRNVMPRTVEVPEYEVHGEVRVDPARTALIAVDMQNDFIKDGGSLVVPGAEETIPAIRRLLDLARESGMKVVFTQDTHDHGDPEWEIWPEHAREESWGWRIVDELAPREDELVIRKVRYDAFYGMHLDHFLRLWGVDTLIVCGTVANICVHYTAASAALRWYDVIIPRDATSALNPFDLESSLRQTAFLFGGTITESERIKLSDTDVYRSKIEEAAAEISRDQ